MSEQLFSLDSGKTNLVPIAATTFQALGMKEADIEALLAKRSGAIFGRDLLWIGRQTWASDNQRSDLIGIDRDGSLVVAELKRGEATPDSLTQAIGYAAHFAGLELEDLARLWHETGSKASGLVAAAPNSHAESLQRLQKKIDSATEANAEQVVVIAAESFDPRLLSSCDYLSESLDNSRLSVECWEYRVHVLGGGTTGYVVTLRQVVPSRTVRDEISARQEMRGEKGSKKTVRFKNAMQTHLQAELGAAGWKFDREGKWYSLTVTSSSWDPSEQASIEFQEGPEPILYLPPGRVIESPADGVIRAEDWKDPTGTVWKRYKFPYASGTTLFTAEIGEAAARTLKAIAKQA